VTLPDARTGRNRKIEALSTAYVEDSIWGALRGDVTKGAGRENRESANRFMEALGKPSEGSRGTAESWDRGGGRAATKTRSAETLWRS